MTCPAYNALTHKEQSEYLAKLIIAVQSDDVLMNDGYGIIGQAVLLGIYEHTRPHADSAALSDINSPIENGVAPMQIPTTHTY